MADHLCAEFRRTLNAAWESLVARSNEVRSEPTNYREPRIQAYLPDVLHLSSVESLQRGLQAGCHICQRIVQRRFKTATRDEDEALDLGNIINNLSQELCRRLFPTYLVMNSVNLERSVPFSVSFQSGPSSSDSTDWDASQGNGFSFTLWLLERVFDDGLNKDLVHDPTNQCVYRAIVDQLKSWLKASANVAIAKSPKPCSLTLPRRILKLLTPNRIQVIEMTTVPNTQYVALSHSWGSLEIPTLTTENIAARMSSFGITTSTLPLHVREAIQSTWDIGFHYIWIYSLCIIQNDKADWLTEASKLARDAIDT